MIFCKYIQLLTRPVTLALASECKNIIYTLLS